MSPPAKLQLYNIKLKYSHEGHFILHEMSTNDLAVFNTQKIA